MANASRHIFLSTLTARREDRRRALGVVVVSAIVFAALAPFAQVQLPAVPAFIPIYESALVINDLITAILLFGQVNLTRSPALLVLACGYVFTALMGAMHALSFPGLFAPTGLLGAGAQSTAWIFMFWHSGFPLAVIAYARLKDRGGTEIVQRRRTAALAMVLTAVLVGGLTWLATGGEDLLPAIMNGSRQTSANTVVVMSVWALSPVALVVLWRARPHSVLDIWLLVVLCSWVFDVGLSAALNAGRFDLGFYAGRVYGLLAASFVLLVLLLETGVLYVRLAQSMEAERDQRERRLQEAQALLIHVSRVSELGLMVPALVHEVNQPLAAITNYLDAVGMSMRDGNTALAQGILQKAVQQVDRAGQILRRLRNFVRREEPKTQPERLAEVIAEVEALALIDSRSRGMKSEVHIDSRLSTVVIDKVQIQQVLLNLIRNAFEAMSASQRRTVVISAVPIASGMAEVSVADTGRGLAEDVRARLFEPFVTTKESGMGVGLSICRSIIESHGGTLRAVDNPGGGTVFRFTLPTQAAQAGKSAAD